MATQTNVIALKRLCAKVIGGDTTADDIKGETIAEVLDEITKNYVGATPATLGKLTLTSVAGSTIGTTKITVTAGASANPKYKIKQTATLPERDADISTWDSWDGVSEITAEDASKWCVCEIDVDNRALKGGTITVTVNM